MLPSFPSAPARRRPAVPAATGGLVVLAVLAGSATDVAPGPLRAPEAQAATTLSDGHVDAVAARIVRGRLRFFVKDATGGSGRVRWREPRDVVLRVSGRARVRLPSGLGFVGRAGSSAWIIPQAQRSGIVWAGWSTEGLSSRQLRGALRWTLRRTTGPGRAVLYQTGSFGDATVLFTSAVRGPQSRSLALGVHGHGNWAFTRRGTYRMTFTLSGTSRAGRPLRTTRTLRIRVG